MRLLITVLLLIPSLVGFSQTDKEKAEGTVQKSTIESHIYFLSDDLLEGRETGRKGNKIAASYLANSLRKYGAKTNPNSGNYYQVFDLIETKAPNTLNFSLNGTPYPLAMAMDMSSIDVTGEAAYLDFGQESDYVNKDVSGKVVIVKGGVAGSTDVRSVFRNGAEKKRLAMDNGAIGLIELVVLEEGMWSNVNHYLKSKTEVPKGENEEVMSDFFHIWVNTKGEDITSSSINPMRYSLQSDGKQRKRIQTQNVVGVIEGTDPKLKNEYIIYSAHYDHVGIGKPNAEGDSIYNGARDNAIGVTAVLSMAENLAKYPTQRSALFIFFTGEEKGLLGSEYYVNHPVLPLNQMVYCFNTDGGGYNDTSLATIIGLERTTAEKNIVKGTTTFGLKPISDPAPEQGLFDRSDNVNFAKVGIPAPTYSTGFSAFDDEIFKYYHQLIDHAESLDFDYLLKFYQGYVYSGRLIANDPETPFWISGDKYEAAGKALYGKE
jgi:aminopeptidase YwaD